MIFEEKFITNTPCWLVATDEAGRGPLAGPVVAGAVAIRLSSLSDLEREVKRLRQLGVSDSKKLSEKKRAELTQLNWHPLITATEVVSSERIDEINILSASLEGMRLAAEKVVSVEPNLPIVWLIDGNRKPKNANPTWSIATIVSGDSHSALIGLASVLAKVERDAIMQELHKKYPAFGFDRHAGYPTEAHREAIALHGPCQIHRKTFKGVREYL